MTPEHLALGVVDAKVWARDPVEFEKDADQKRAERRAKPIEDKESIRWMEGYRAACQVAQEAPETHIVSLADSEGDIYEYLLEAQAVEGVRKASFIIRACQNRALVDARRGSGRRSRPAFCGSRSPSTPVLAQRTLEIRGRDPKSKDDRKRKQPREPRTAVVVIRAARVKLRGPSRPGGKLPDLEVNVVLVSEPNPPPGAEPIEWILLTDLPIDTVEDVLRVIDYYMCRWQIEIYFRILKSGCKVEESQLETAARFEPYLALCMIVAWRIMYVMMLGRECPDLPCDMAFDDDEWQAVYATVKKEPPPSQPPSMKTMVGLIASLGGWLGRKCDGEPGPKAMWVGMQRMTDLALGWRARAEHSGDATKEIVPALSGAESSGLRVPHLARRFAADVPSPKAGSHHEPGRDPWNGGKDSQSARVGWSPGDRCAPIAPRLRGCENRTGPRHTVQRLIQECPLVVPVVAARPCAGVGRNPWVTTRALPWAFLFRPLRGGRKRNFKTCEGG